MRDENKRLLIVDDSMIDREVLKSILCDEFDIVEAENGYVGLEIVLNGAERLDGIMLDVSMPILDGFSVLQILRERGIGDVPVFMITAEATKGNVERAIQLNAAEFIKKPFDRDEVIKRVETQLGLVVQHKLDEQDVEEINDFIAELEALYRKYLTNFGRDTGHYTRMTGLMRILLKRHSATAKEGILTEAQIEIASRAAFFCDIGFMLLPGNSRQIQSDGTESESYQSHAALGAELLHLNHSERCEYFVKLCSDMCMHHHERYDGAGFPDRLVADANTIYAQLCRLADEFDNLYFRYRDHGEGQFTLVARELARDEGVFGQGVLSLFMDCKDDIIQLYNA